MAVFCLQDPIDIDKLLERAGGFVGSETSSNLSPKQGSVIHVWRVVHDEKVCVEPVQLTPLPELDDSQCYMVLHTFGHVPDNSTAKGSYEATAELCLSAVLNCAERGLTRRITDNPLYDLYQWNGIKANSAVKSITLGKAFQLNTSLSAIAARLDFPLHDYLISDSKPVPLQHSKPAVPSTFPLLAQNNHLFARVTTNVVAPPNKTRDRKETVFLNAETASNLALPAMMEEGSGSSSPVTAPRPKPNLNINAKGKATFPGLLSANPSIPLMRKPEPLPITPRGVVETPVAPPPAETPFSLDIGQVEEGKADGAIEQDERLRKQRKLDHFDKQCSKITDRLFLGSKTVACNKRILKNNGITHIINTARVICDDYHADDASLNYLSFYLADGQYEAIECVFHDALEFMEQAFSQSPDNKVFVHCFQGVSRSSTTVLLWLIVHDKMTYDEAYKHARARRGIVEPNTGFMVQLRAFEKRHREGVTYPRLYEVGPHKPQDTTRIVGRAVRDPTKRASDVFKSVQSSSLDVNRNFVLHTPPGKIFVWLGSSAPGEEKEGAFRLARMLVKYEQGKEIVEVSDKGDLGEFWEFFEDKGAGFKSGNMTQRVAVADAPVAKRKESIQEEEEDGNPQMFEFPDGDEIEMFDSDDLIDDCAFLVVDTTRKLSKVAYFWVGAECDLTSEGAEKAAAAGKKLLEEKGITGYDAVQVVGDDFDGEPTDFWAMFTQG